MSFVVLVRRNNKINKLFKPAKLLLFMVEEETVPETADKEPTEEEIALEEKAAELEITGK